MDDEELIKEFIRTERGADGVEITVCYIALGFSWTLDCEKVLAGGVSR